MSKILVFAGTTEGRRLLEALSKVVVESGLTIVACVATDYGKELLLEKSEQIQILTGRLTEDEMKLLMDEHQFDFVIDTTHPYAKIVSENIQKACIDSGCKYIRLLRQNGWKDYKLIDKGPMDISKRPHCIFFENHNAVVDYLNKTTGNVLLTIGSKELVRYTEVKNFENRLFPRVLPMLEVMQHCFDIGFTGKQLISMQGPFSLDLNIALLNQIKAHYLVTKDSGEAGGFWEKYEAAQRTDITLLVVGRSGEEKGNSLEEVLKLLEEEYHISFGLKEDTVPGHWFPLFTNILGKKIIVIGAGKIAKRRIQALSNFDCKIKVVSMEALPEVVELAEVDKLELQLKSYEPSDLDGADYVLAASNSKELNYEIYLECKKKKIPVNVADDKGKSDFYFPGIVRKNGVTVGVTAEGKNHGLAKKATRAIGHCLNTSLLEE